MKEYYDVIKAALELLETVQEGFNQSRNLLLKQKYEDAFFMLQDSIEGILSVDQAIKPVLNELKKDKFIEPSSAKLKASINQIIDDYETNNGANTLKILISELNPNFTKWSNKIKKELSPLHSLLSKMISKYGRGSTGKLF